MYVSIRDATLLETGFDSIIEGLQHYGLAAVELAVNREGRVRALRPTADRPFVYLNKADDVEELSRQAREEGVSVSAFLLPNDFNATEMDRELSWIIAVTQAASDLGVPTVRIDAVMSGEQELTMDDRLARFSRAVDYVLQKTEGLAVDLGIENHGRQGNDPEFLEGLLASFGSDRLGITLDTGNFYWAGHPLDEVYAILRRLAPLAKHTHVKNIRYPEEIRNVRREVGYEYSRYVCPITEGDIDHRRVVEILSESGYHQDLCLEDESLGKFGEKQRRENVRAAVAYFRAQVG
jgi:sugar phosphate isomerase/epimerase